MPESTPPSHSRIEEMDERPRSRPLRLIDHPMRPSSPSHPPSEPRPIPGRPGADASPDRPARVQLIAALLLLLVLVVVPLYLWRRPRAAATEETASPPASALMTTQAAEPAPSADPKVHTKDGVTITDAKVIGCHDRGSKRTSAGACDRLPTFENAFAKAVLDAASCAPAGTPAGAIAFVVDASYGRHKSPVHVSHGRDGTTMPPKVVAACIADVKKALAQAPFDQAHSHLRYQIEIDATYAGKR